MPFELVLSPQGHLHVREASQPDAAGLDGAVGKRIHAAFADSTARGLLHLATTELQSSLPPPLGFVRDFARLYLTRLCQTPVDGESGKVPAIPPPSESDLAFQVLQAPPMLGSEYLELGSSRGLVDRPRRACPRRDRKSSRRCAGIPQRAQPPVAVRRPRHVPPGREQARPGAPVRVPGDVHSQPVGPGSRPARAAGRGTSAIRRRQEPASLLSLLVPIQRRERTTARWSRSWSIRTRSIIPWPGRRARRIGSCRTFRSSRKAA